MAKSNDKPHGNLRVLLLALVAFLFLVDEIRCEVYRSLQWSPDNAMFKPNSSGCGDGVIRMNVLPNSKIHVICPSTVTVLDTVQSSKPKHELHENLWIAFDNQSFETCVANASNAGQPESRLLMRCDKPLELKYYTLVFQEFSPAAGGLEFKPGKEYYFLATSDGSEASLGSSSGGHCNDKANDVAMKFKVYVCSDQSDPLCTKNELGKLYCETRDTTSTVEPSTPSSTVSAPSIRPTASSKEPCAAVTSTVWVNRTLCDKNTLAVEPTVTPSPCVCPMVTQVRSDSDTGCVSPSQSALPTDSCTFTTIYSAVTHTILVNRTAVCDNKQVTPSSVTCACVTQVASNTSTHSSKLPSSNAYISTSSLLVPQSAAVTRPALVNQSTLRDSMVGNGRVTPSSNASADVYPVTVTHTLEILNTVCDGVTLSRSTITPTRTHLESSIHGEPDNRSRLARQGGSERLGDEDSWKTVAIFFICICVVVIPLLFLIYKKWFLKRKNRVSPSPYEPRDKPA